MAKIFLSILTLALIFALNIPETYAFMGGSPAQQTRTIGGKNPLKQRNIRRANPQTKVYHNSSCKYFKSKQSTIMFKSAQEAMLSGFRPCTRCGG